MAKETFVIDDISDPSSLRTEPDICFKKLALKLLLKK